jgi:hypothetical protein
MKINSILVTQRRLKRMESIPAMVQEIYSYSSLQEPIQLVQLEDGTVYIKNGHHRTAAYALAGRTELLPWEYDLLFSDEIKPTFGNIQKLLAQI